MMKVRHAIAMLLTCAALPGAAQDDGPYFAVTGQDLKACEALGKLARNTAQLRDLKGSTLELRRAHPHNDDEILVEIYDALDAFPNGNPFAIERALQAACIVKRLKYMAPPK